ncbi:MAG: hypothetical protein IPK52_21885 [Chloroflexi bacterium]|nr:hypothetical protein [Chloroflexota bacterium]
MTTDALLNTLGQLFTSAQKDLEQGRIGSLFSLILIDVVTAAVAQWTMAAGTPLEEPARRAAVDYAVAALAMNGGTDSLPAPIRAAAEAIYVMIAAGQDGDDANPHQLRRGFQSSTARAAILC